MGLDFRIVRRNIVLQCSMEARMAQNPWQPLFETPFVKRFIPELAVWSWTDPNRAMERLAGIQRAALDVTIETLEQTAELLRQVRDKNVSTGGAK